MAEQGVFFSRFVRNSSISRNSFTAVGDSAILIVGASGKHRTNQAHSREYPAFNHIEENHVDTVGVWGKQSAAYFKSVTRGNIVRRNVFHDGPRSGVNYSESPHSWPCRVLELTRPPLQMTGPWAGKSWRATSC